MNFIYVFAFLLSVFDLNWLIEVYLTEVIAQWLLHWLINWLIDKIFRYVSYCI